MKLISDKINWFFKDRKRVQKAFYILIFAIIALVSVLDYRKNRLISEPRYLVAIRDLDSGHYIQWQDVTIKHIKNEINIDGALTDQYLHLIKGKKLVNSVPSGAVLLKSYFEVTKRSHSIEERIPEGMLAYSIILNETTPSKSGDFINVLLRSDEKKNSSLNIAENILVVGKRELNSTQVELVLALFKREVRFFEKSRKIGNFTVLLNGNKSEQRLRKVQSIKLLNSWKRKQKKIKKIQIIS